MVAPPPGPASARWVEVLARTECPSLTTRRARRAERSGAPNDPIVWAEAKGANVRDVDGNVYVDLTAGFSVAAAGHAHPEIVAAVQRQVALLPHALGDVHPSEPKIALLERLAALSPFDDARIILGLNGADALAAAMKTAVLATGRPGILAFEGGYHGLMYGALSLCGYAPGFREPFAAQLNPHVRFVPYPTETLAPTLDALDAAWGDDIGAIVVEPALGRGGLRFPPEGFLRALAERCRARGALLVVDEIFTGFGRTGRRWALDHEGVVPDMVCAGKALGGGLPISACIATAEVMAAWGDPDGEAIHTATFGANPLACAASLASLEVIERDGLADRARDEGAIWLEELRARLGHHAAVREVRGRGLMIGVELDDGRRTLGLVASLLARGYLALPAGPGASVLQLTPPLIISRDLLRGATAAIGSILDGDT
jgi:4-aminobutyrate aminotransferase/(S)-3-amino-2-methylpropionate transaminase